MGAIVPPSHYLYIIIALQNDIAVMLSFVPLSIRVISNHHYDRNLLLLIFDNYDFYVINYYNYCAVHYYYNIFIIIITSQACSVRRTDFISM